MAVKRATRWRELIGRRTRSLIYRTVRAPGDKWKGTRRGVKMEIEYYDRRMLRGKPRSWFVWRARLNGEWISEAEETLHDAIESLEELAP